VSAHPKWYEWEGEGLGGPDAKVMFAVGFTDDITLLAQTIRESGWVDRRRAAEIANLQNLQVGWHGYVEGELTPHACDHEGNIEVGDGRVVDIVIPLTWIVVAE
jgi:hypothetical protein